MASLSSYAIKSLLPYTKSIYKMLLPLLSSVESYAMVLSLRIPVSNWLNY